MIDIHSHVLYGIDDGAKTIEESILLLKNMKKIGINVVVATPHYISETSYIKDNSNKSYLIGQIKEEIKLQNIGIDLYLGNEVFIDRNIHEFVRLGKVATINSSKYLLLELPRNTEILELFDILFKLRSRGYIIIIAHPERYVFLQRDYKYLNKILEMGCLFQGNFENAIGRYGSEAEKIFWYMLSHNKYQFLATDVHHNTDKLFENFPKIENNIKKVIGDNKYHEITHVNPMKVLKNDNIDIGEIYPVIKKFGKWK